mmetsp:Transcript_43216/g.84480  ORF Transcript_43216/g.84480 Transcript_43216/m.84480 type:complete len:89 (+) Transcript_43216:24-290(+)
MARRGRVLGVAAVMAAMLPGAAAFWPLQAGMLSVASGRRHNCGQGGVQCTRMSVLDGMSAKDIDGNLIDLGAAYGEAPAVVVVNVATD